MINFQINGTVHQKNVHLLVVLEVLQGKEIEVHLTSASDVRKIGSFV